VAAATQKNLLMSDADRTMLIVMRSLFIGLLLYASVDFTAAQTNIRHVDFKNFTYPLNGTLLGHDRLQWLDMSSDAHPNRKPVHLVNGDDLMKASSFVMDGHEYIQWEGFTLQSVEFADVTGAGKEDAIVVLKYFTGGTQNTHYVYIYSFDDGKPKLLAYCHTGDRGDNGLYKVYGDREALVFELLDPKKMSGLCCSSGFVRMRYKWHNGRFEVFGKSEREALEEQ
jgi:hypothetical protein